LRAAKNENLGDYEEEPRITRIRTNKDERGEWRIRAYPRNPRLDFLVAAERSLAALGISSNGPKLSVVLFLCAFE
jgi:hypothetical protein